MFDLKNDCTDKSCGQMGSGWSHIILANAILMILLFCNLGCIIMGRIRAKWRLLGAYAGFALALAHFGILIAAAIYRFRPQGALCSLDLTLTDFPTSNPKDSGDSWSFEKDGSLILALWVLQIIGAPMCCLLASK